MFLIYRDLEWPKMIWEALRPLEESEPRRKMDSSLQAMGVNLRPH